MKFLCFTCDEGMKLEATGGPREGSIEATFVCPRCRHKIVMLTNPWETQLIQTLGVKVGGRATAATPYEQVFGSLAQAETEGLPVGDDGENSPGCPFAGMLGADAVPGISEGIQWTAEACTRIERIPSFIRPMVQRAIERYAVEQGYP